MTVIAIKFFITFLVCLFFSAAVDLQTWRYAEWSKKHNKKIRIAHWFFGFAATISFITLIWSL